MLGRIRAYSMSLGMHDAFADIYERKRKQNEYHNADAERREPLNNVFIVGRLHNEHRLQIQKYSAPSNSYKEITTIADAIHGTIHRFGNHLYVFATPFLTKGAKVQVKDSKNLHNSNVIQINYFPGVQYRFEYNGSNSKMLGKLLPV